MDERGAIKLNFWKCIEFLRPKAPLTASKSLMDTCAALLGSRTLYEEMARQMAEGLFDRKKPMKRFWIYFPGRGAAPAFSPFQAERIDFPVGVRYNKLRICSYREVSYYDGISQGDHATCVFDGPARQ